MIALAARVEEAWTKLERRLAIFALLAEMLVLVGWVILKGLASADLASNLVGWIQNASVLTMIGGPRGMATRLTLWVALLGASIAASKSKHIRIDLLSRFLPHRVEGLVVRAGAIAAAVVCFAASWGFIDSIAVTKFRAEAFTSCADSNLCDTPISARLGKVGTGMSEDLFLLGRQLSLDFKTIPAIMSGDRYDDYLTATEWNEWIRDGGWDQHFAADQVHSLLMPDDPALKRIPAVAAPDTGEGRDLLLRDLNLILPFGLLIIALKFLLRALQQPVSEGGGSPSRAGKIALGVAGAAVVVLAITSGWVAALVSTFALLGAPLFAVLGGAAELSWLTHAEQEYRHLRFIAPTVLDSHFSDSPILVTIPLFTFVGYVLAEAKTPDRLIAGARSVLGWLPGGLAIVAVIASAVFTLLTGGSGVTIIAVGGLLYPALRKQNYSEKFSLGLVTSGGSVGLLLPYSLPLLIFALVAHVDFVMAFKAVLVPGALVILLLSLYSVWVGVKEKIPRERPRLDAIASSMWALKWELVIPVILIVGLGTGATAIDEAAGLVAVYTLIIELFVYRDISWKKDLERIVESALGMAGAIIIILAMANSLMNYVVDQRIPTAILDWLLAAGIEHRWQFLIIMNVFLLVLGMLMEGFSAIFVAVPLILPFVADLGQRHPNEAMSPFQLAMIFILNLELAYCMPPLGLNLFIASFRFNKPVQELYRVVLPFIGILTIALALVSYIPWLSDVAVEGDIAALRQQAEKDGLPPRDAWMMECVQADPNDPKPCSEADRKKYANVEAPPDTVTATTGEDCNPDFGPCG